MAAVISRTAYQITIVCDTDEEAAEWFAHLHDILQKMYPDDNTYHGGTVQTEGEDT